MSNPLFNQMNNDPMRGFMQEFERFRQSFRGDPRAKVQEMMNNGQLSQEQFNQIAQQTNQLMRFFK